jgi:hypothetical protein
MKFLLTPWFFYLSWGVVGVAWFLYEKWKERRGVK